MSVTQLPTIPPRAAHDHDPYDRRDSAAEALRSRRAGVQTLADSYRARGLDPREIPGLRQMLTACRQAQATVHVIDLELSGARIP